MAKTSMKRLQINKANTTMVAVVAIASFIVVFSLVASRALLSQWSFNGRVIKEKQAAVNQLQNNLKAVDSLLTSYNAFAGASENLLGGSSDGAGDMDGDNARLVLDALPSKYDFPALVTSLEKLLEGHKINSIHGVDDQANQESVSMVTPLPVEMPFTINVSGSFESIQTLVSTLERSIRPVQVQKIDLSADNQDLQAIIEAKTFYQPEKKLEIRTKEVR